MLNCVVSRQLYLHHAPIIPFLEIKAPKEVFFLEISKKVHSVYAIALSITYFIFAKELYFF